MLHLAIRDIRIRSPRLELRLPDLDLLEELATLAARGVHPSDYMPFGTPWTDQSSPQLERSTIQWHLLQLASWTPQNWSFNPVVLFEGRVAGTQGISAHDFKVTRSFLTGSWLGREYQGRGLGKEMRAAILHFGFVGLGAAFALSGAFADNAASLALSRSLGYEENGLEVIARRGEPATELGLRLSRARWESSERPEVELSSLDGCLSWFGVDEN